VRKNKALKPRIIFLSFGVLSLIILLSFIPVISLKRIGMNTVDDGLITVFYEKNETAAKDVLGLAVAENGRVAAALGFDTPINIKIYIYDKQSVFQTKKYGLWTLLLNQKWYVGDNIGTDVLMASPGGTGDERGYGADLIVAVHEMVHAYNSVIDDKMPLWVNEGLANYIAGQDPGYYSFRLFFIPTIKEMKTNNPVAFANMGGYPLSYIYIEYLDKTFGWDGVLYFIKNNDFIGAFGADEKDVYNGWVRYIDERYR